MNSLIDKQVNYILNKITGINFEDIYNYYDLKGANPEKVIINASGERMVVPYSPKTDTFVMFGVEEVETGKESYIVVPSTGSPDNTIIITQKLKVIIEINGKNAQAYALRIKALLWRYDIMEYLEENKISVLTQNPEIEFMNEIVNEEMWERRGMSFEVIVELEYNNSEIPELTDLSQVTVQDLENLKEEDND